jgi:hypothetical protein
MAPSHDPKPEGAAAGLLRLHHGTDLASANDILHNGLDQIRAAALNVTGEFWATTDVATADTFAQVNPVAGQPARFDFDVPIQEVQALLTANPPGAYLSGNDTYEFLPSSYRVLNFTMTNRQVISPVP